MSDAFPRPGTERRGGVPNFRAIDDISEFQYRGSAANHKVRRHLTDEYADPPLGEIEIDGVRKRYGIDLEIISALQLEGDETIVDVGCGDGEFLVLLSNLGHQGYLVGVDKFSSNYIKTEETYGSSQLGFVESDAHRIRVETLPRRTAKVVTHKFLGYHLSRPRTSISTARRLLDFNGQLVIATRNPGHHARLWGFMEDMSEELKEMSRSGEIPTVTLPSGEQVRPDYEDVRPPKSFYSQFDMDIAEATLRSLGLDITYRYMQSTLEGSSILRIPGKEWETYRAALLSVVNLFRPPLSGSMTNLLIDQVVKPVFDEEVARTGHFTESVEQGFLIARKPRLPRLRGVLSHLKD